MFRKRSKDLKLNVHPIEAVIRASMGLGIPVLLVIWRPLWLIITVIILATYLLITSMMFFCPLKHLLQHQLAGKKGATEEEKEMPLKKL
jgi:hypothetical protein